MLCALSVPGLLASTPVAEIQACFCVGPLHDFGWLLPVSVFQRKYPLYREPFCDLPT